MLFDGQRQPNTLYVASVSRGKDSTAMLRAIQLMNWPLDAICSVDIWFDNDTPAELPPMVAFKDEWDAKCIEWFGVPVTRLCATKRGCSNKLTYTDFFYCKVSPQREKERELRLRGATGINYGFPTKQLPWCNSGLKRSALKVSRLRATTTEFSDQRPDKAQKINIVYYIGIAADEPLRIERHLPKKDKIMPLVQIGWDEELCGLEATYMDMLSPTYEGSCRDGCWFCHNQGIDQLRNLRKNYPNLWEKMLKLDLDSPVTFKPPGKNGKRGLTVHDFDKRFQWEDDGFLPVGKQFRWADIEEPQMNIWQLERFC